MNSFCNVQEKKTQNTCLFVLFHFKTTQSQCHFKEALLK